VRLKARVSVEGLQQNCPQVSGLFPHKFRRFKEMRVQSMLAGVSSLPGFAALLTFRGRRYEVDPSLCEEVYVNSQESDLVGDLREAIK